MRFYRILTFVFLISILAGGCGLQSGPSATPTPLPPPADTATPAPTITPIMPPDVVILSGKPDGSYNDMKAVLDNMAPKNGLAVVAVEEFKKEDLGKNVRVVVFATPPPDLRDLVQAGAQTHFIVVSGDINLQPAVNLSIIRLSPLDMAFAGGYLTVVLAADWRAAGLLPSEEPIGPALVDAYVNGARAFCGRCASVQGPVTVFPLTASAGMAASVQDWMGAMEPLWSKDLRVLYLDPAIQVPELPAALAAKNVLLVGGSTPPADPAARARWAAGLRFAPAQALSRLWPDIVAGKSNQVINAPLHLQDVNSEMLSTGRQNWIEQALEELAAGMIMPQSPAY